VNCFKWTDTLCGPFGRCQVTKKQSETHLNFSYFLKSPVSFKPFSAVQLPTFVFWTDTFSMYA